MTAALLILLLIYAWRAPSSWIGRQMSILAAAATRRLSRIRPVQIIVCIALLAAVAALLAVLHGEGVVLGGAAGSEALAWFSAMDVGAAVEVVAVAWMLGAGKAVRRAVGAMRSFIHERRTAPRARRRAATRPRPTGRSKPADEDPAGLAWLARLGLQTRHAFGYPGPQGFAV